ncbi:hypothetical protein BP6252_06688 [Coleophoma cylindrospora]|uniref:Enoyl reductase (ER) domain-containing protein n=1 Tax=Coleophoma cylindrospora TaxID=1849047 RepID=A0A3D8RNL7_9HELO|nr:hypothetical protein BP6252_06688 [Coleophoma cylindrospora]
MKEALVSAGPTVTIVESPIPKYNDDQVLIKVAIAGSNPKDWKRADASNVPFNQGEDVAGTIFAVGDNITEFKVGDRVAGYHQFGKSGGTYAQYAVCYGFTTFHIPKKISFEEAATIPMAALVAATGLFSRLRLPPLWDAATKPCPLIIYGASSAVGSFAVKLAKASNIHPIIAVAGKGAPYVESLIDRSKGDTIIDYRQSDEAIVGHIRTALSNTGQSKLEYAFDVTSDHGSFQNIIKVLDPAGHINLINPNGDFSAIPESFHRTITVVISVHRDVSQDPWFAEASKQGVTTGGKEFGFIYSKLFGRGLSEGWFSGHPFEVVPGGLDGIEKGLKDLKSGKASAVKYIYRIEDTPTISILD